MSDALQGRAPANDLEPHAPGTVIPAPVNYAPLVERAPELVRDSILKAHTQAAEQIEQACDALNQELVDCINHGRATAQAIREYGASEAAAAENALGLAREMSRNFRAQRERLIAFASGPRT